MNLLEFKGWLINEQDGRLLVLRCPCRYAHGYRTKGEYDEPSYFHLKDRSYDNLRGKCPHESIPKEIMVAFRMIK